MILYFSNSLSEKDLAISAVIFQLQDNISLSLNLRKAFNLLFQSCIVRGIFLFA
jgi:hypothetical protein